MYIYRKIFHFLDKLQILTNMMMPSVIVAIGNRASIGCYATGAPPIRYTWTKNGIPVNSSGVMKNVLVVQPMTSLDYGNYSCHVSNENQTESYSIQVKPLERSESCPDLNKNQTQGQTIPSCILDINPTTLLISLNRSVTYAPFIIVMPSHPWSLCSLTLNT